MLPAIPDVIGLLVTQGEITLRGISCFVDWSDDGSSDTATAVDKAEQDADVARRNLLVLLQNALSTPVDQEDIYMISERTDQIINEAKHTVGEAEILHWTPDAHALAMAKHIYAGTDCLVEGFRLIHSDSNQAGVQADKAVKAVRHVERRYRSAMAELLQLSNSSFPSGSFGDTATTGDIRSLIVTQELYRHYVQVADAVVRVADRLWFSVLRDV